MSNQFISQSMNDPRNTPKPQRKHGSNRDFRNPSLRNTLSNALRATAASNTGGSASMTPETSRVRMSENGESLSKASASGNFVVYLPQDDAVAAGLGPEEGGLDPVESQRVVDLLNRELSRLLKMRPRDFWREVATDESLHAFLESFLKFRSRWYDFPHRGARGIVAGVIVGEFELCRRVFMILYRISSNRDPGAKGADFLSSKDHEELLQDKKLLDLPKLLDICAIFGHENEELTRVLVMNAVKAQADIQQEFSVLISHFLSIVQTMHQRCDSYLELLLSSGAHQDPGSNRLYLDYLEVLEFINDSVVSLDSFVNACKSAAVFFSSPIETGYGTEELLVMLARLHDSLLPSLHSGFRKLFGPSKDKKNEMSEDLLSNVSTCLKMLSTRIAKLGWTLLYYCFLSDDAFESSTHSPWVSMKMFPATVDDPVVRADILIQTIRDLTNEQKHFINDQTRVTFIQDIEKNFKMMSRIELLQETGWLSMDDSQFQLLSAITMTQPHAATKRMGPTASMPATQQTQTDEDMAITESKISQIKELFPDYGRGYLTACLEAYNHEPEQVIQMILEGTLHEELQSLDTSLETAPPAKYATSAIHGSRDKGKGKLVEPPPVISPESPGPTIASSASSSSFGRFVRKNTGSPSYSETMNAKEEKVVEKTAALASRFEYEDEYDDSFDDLGLSVADAGPDETESQMLKMSPGGDGGGAKWGSRKKPQFFVKDGKNYSYKVEGSVAVVDRNEARLVNQAQRELIHGLGQGGNIPMGAVKKLIESPSEEERDGHDEDGVGRQGGRGGGRGRGRRGFFRGGLRKSGESNEGQEVGEGENNEEVGGRGLGRRGGRGGSSNYRKARAMSKQLTGLPAHYR